MFTGQADSFLKVSVLKILNIMVWTQYIYKNYYIAYNIFI